MLTETLVNPIGSGATRQAVFCLYVGNPASLGREPKASFCFFLNLAIGCHSDAR